MTPNPPPLFTSGDLLTLAGLSILLLCLYWYLHLSQHAATILPSVGY